MFGHHTPRQGLGTRRGLDLDVELVAIGLDIRRQVAQRGQWLPGVLAAVPATGIELGQCFPALIAAHAGAGRGSFKRGVVHQERHAVG
jgi:hypothetical protein